MPDDRRKANAYVQGAWDSDQLCHSPMSVDSLTNDINNGLRGTGPDWTTKKRFNDQKGQNPYRRERNRPANLYRRHDSKRSKHSLRSLQQTGSLWARDKGAASSRQQYVPHHDTKIPYYTGFRWTATQSPAQPSRKKENGTIRNRSYRHFHRLLNRFRVARYFVSCCVLLLTLLIAGKAAYANASLEISPIRIILTENAPVATVHIRNRSERDAVVQLQWMSWAQEDNDDVFGEATELLTCPPLFELRPDEEQIIRIGFTGDFNPDWSTESSYRLIIREVPPPPTDNDGTVQMTVQVSIPIFLQPNSPQKPDLEWLLQNKGTDGLWATVKNNGNQHVLVGGIVLKTGDTIGYRTNTHQYILPGATMSWRIDAQVALSGPLPESVTLLASTDQGAYEETLSITK